MQALLSEASLIITVEGVHPTAWQAITMPPRAFLTSTWPWRSLLYLLSGVAVGAISFLVFYLLLIGAVVTIIYVVGLLLLCGFALCGILVARFERARLRLVDDNPVVDPHRPPPRPGWRSWISTRAREPMTWRELAYALASIALWALDAVVVVLGSGPLVIIVSAWIDRDADVLVTLAWTALGVLLIPVMAYPITAWAAARAEITRAVLAPKETELGHRLTEVTNSRARLVGAFEAERRRIERDLHDGTQQRLVALSVELGLARLDVGEDSAAGRRIGAAQHHARQALTELRELVRGVYPQLLIERGLAPALEDLAGRCSVPVDVTVRLPRRLPEPVEATAYFAVSEALANLAKHSGATRATVSAQLDVDLLVVEITDDGRGGADAGAGTGLLGLADRLAVLDGRLFVSSPPGGPTVVRLEVPCSQIDR